MSNHKEPSIAPAVQMVDAVDDTENQKSSADDGHHTNTTDGGHHSETTIGAVGSSNDPVDQIAAAAQSLRIEHVKNLPRVKEYDYVCEVCEMSFGKQLNLYKHVIRVHEKKRQYCKCGAGFNHDKLKALKTHQQLCVRAMGDRLDDPELKKAKELQAAVEECTGKVAWCDICRIKFPSKKERDSHRVMNHNWFVCSCNRRFFEKDGLQNHWKAKGPPTIKTCYECSICKVKFPTMSISIAHEQEHNQEKPLEEKRRNKKEGANKCSECSMYFKTVLTLARHNIMNHPEKSPYSCHVCKLVFPHQCELAGHKCMSRKVRKHQMISDPICYKK